MSTEYFNIRVDICNQNSKRCRERDFFKKGHDCVDRGGKVLIPVFALGRAQELCILLETYWERMNIKAPIYFAVGMTEKANSYYKMFITWTNQKIRKTFVVGSTDEKCV